MSDEATAIAQTVVADSREGPSVATSRPASSTFARTTVLPRKAAVDELPRYAPVRTLGEGGMGEVVLVRDQDIGRDVAVKRLKAGSREEAAVLRFAEEVRTVGRLEHPGIVPIHDVGVDEDGQHYLVMKYVQGETLEQIIKKLGEGDASYVRRFTVSHRAQIFLALLQALRYAHEKGVIHRDLKPANVMVGPYGEVMLMDWGIAKTIERGVADANVDVAKVALADTANGGADEGRLVKTAHGSLLGTPLYMSPEQAMGRTHELDERSDVYSASMLFLELLTLRHPFADKTTVQEVLLAHAGQEIGSAEMAQYVLREGLRAEYGHFLRVGLAKNPADRYENVAEMEMRLKEILEGRIRIQCRITFAKRVAWEVTRWIDRHPIAYTLLGISMVLVLLAGLALGIVHLVR